MVPVEKPPLISLFTIVLGVLSEVDESTDEATDEIVDEFTPPTLLIVAAAVTSAVPLNTWTYVALVKNDNGYNKLFINNNKIILLHFYLFLKLNLFFRYLQMHIHY